MLGQDGEGRSAASLSLAGRSVAQRQLDLALALGCERIACVAEGPSPDLIALQHVAERAGAKFNAVTGIRALSGLVHAPDEMLAFEVGVLPELGLIAELLDERAAVLAFPAEEAIAAGFERIDPAQAWAGALLVRGSAVERLADLAPDSDPIASLLRAALQSGARVVRVPAETLADGRWTRIVDDDTRRKAESRWLAETDVAGSWRQPGHFLATRLVRMFAPALLIRARTAAAFDAAGCLLVLVAAGLGWIERPVAGFGILALGSALFVAARALRAIKRGPGARPVRAWDRWATASLLLLDATMALGAVLASPLQPRFAAFSAIVLILAMRLAANEGEKSAASFAADRVLVFGGLAAAAGFDQLLPVIQVLALTILALVLIAPTKARLTPI